jgi:glutamine synthetase
MTGIDGGIAAGFDAAHDARPLVRRLGKPPDRWTRADLVDLCARDGVRVLNLRYPGFDGKLRELRVPINSAAQLERVLATGERVDGSSLFPGLFRSSSSDVYAVPVYRWAFPDPWAEDELHVVCRFAGADGAPCPLTPDTVLANAVAGLRERTGATLEALAEIEFYLALDRKDDRFSGLAQRNYHQAAPFLHGRAIVDEILRAVSAATGAVKYCHAEVGYVDRIESDVSEIAGRRAEQFELEFSLVPIEDLAAWMAVARWFIRVIADRHGASVTFAPKLEHGAAGSGMHFHLAVKRDGLNTMREGGDLSDDALRLIGGLLAEVPALCGLGNTIAGSYLRLVPGQEAPTRIFWGRHNRSSLIRIPLVFQTERRLDQAMNPREDGPYPDLGEQATIEYRSPDGSAFAQLLLAAVTLCVAEGLSSPEAAERAKALERRPGEEAGGRGGELPTSAVEAADRLEERRAFFEAGGFPGRMLDLVLEKLRAENDRDLDARLAALPAAERLAETRRLMHKDLHKR